VGFRTNLKWAESRSGSFRLDFLAWRNATFVALGRDATANTFPLEAPPDCWSPACSSGGGPPCWPQVRSPQRASRQAVAGGLAGLALNAATTGPGPGAAATAPTTMNSWRPGPTSSTTAPQWQAFKPMPAPNFGLMPELPHTQSRDSAPRYGAYAMLLEGSEALCKQHRVGTGPIASKASVTGHLPNRQALQSPPSGGPS